MIGYTLKLARGTALAISFANIYGCASDGGVTELATMGLLLNPMGMDTGTLVTVATVATGAMLVASATSDDSTSNASPAGAPATQITSKPELQKLVDRETPERYRPRSCEYLEMAFSEIQNYSGSSVIQMKQAGEARKTAVTQVWQEKGCSASNLPRGVLGIFMETIDAEKAAIYSLPTTGVVVEKIASGSGAQKAGIMPSDVIVAVNDYAISDSIEFRVQVAKAAIGSSLKLKTWRAQAFQSIPVVVGQSANQVSLLPTSAPASGSTAQAHSASLQGMSLGAVTPSYAKAVGLASATGAWVTDTDKGSAADKAGIKPLDVIIEVGGQEVASAQDLSDISSRMRPGYKATVSVWRNQAKKDVKMVLRNE